MTDSRSLELILRLKDEASTALSGVSKKLDNFQQRIEPAADASRKFALGLVAVGTAVGGLGVLAIKEAATIESLKMGLNAVSGSAAETEKQLVRLREIAKLPGLGFKEAIQGSINLQAAGLSADLAERSLKAFGNALATVGRGKADLDGVSLALTQISAKGKVSAQEILQLQERLPQIRQAMIAAFGTADTEALQKQGIDSQTFIGAIVKEFEKLPPVTSGLNNQIENLRDTWNIFLANEGAKLIEWAKRFIEILSNIVEHHLPRWIEKTERVIGWLKENEWAIAALAGVITALLVPAIISIATTFAQTILALTVGNPWGLVIGGVIALAVLIIQNWETIKAKTIEIWEAIKTFLQQHWEKILVITLGPLGLLVVAIVKHWNTIKETTVSVWSAIRDFFTGVWDEIKNIFKGSIDWISDKMNGLLSLVDKAKGAASSIGNTIGSGFSAVGKAIGVNDAIIAPNGNIITTHPDDYLIATKNPHSLAGGNVVVNVYGDVSGTELVAKVSEGIMNTLRLNARLPV